MKKETIKLNVTVDHKRFYNPDSMWGVFGVKPNTEKEKIETLDWNGVFAISGNCPDLQIGEKYNIEIEPSYNKKYGKGYSIVSVDAKRPNTVEEQMEYLRMMVTEKQFEEIQKVYPNHKVLDLMEDGKFKYKEVKGLGEKTYDRIKKFLFGNLEIQEALVKLKDLNVTYASTKRLIDHFKTARTLVQIVESDIYRLCEVSGFGFKTVDQYALNRGDDPTSDKRIKAAIIHLLEQNAANGHSWMELKSLIGEVEKLIEIDVRYIEDFIGEIKEKSDKTIYKDESRIALAKNYRYELLFTEKLEEMIKSPPMDVIKDVEARIDKLERENGFKYTSEQREAIKKSTENNIMVINGKAGTGKSFTIKSILDIHQGHSYMTVALSGKAAKVLRDNGLQSKTIHKMLAERQIDEETGKVYPVPYDIVVVDEASMVNNYLFYEIINSLKDGAKLFIVGDNGQVPAIGTGANFDNMIRYGNVPRQELTIVHRQAQKSGILSVANDIRDGKQINPYGSEESEVYGELEDMFLIPTNKETDIVQMVVDISERNKDKDIFEFQVVTGRVDNGDISVKNLNIELQKVFNDINKPFISRGGYDYREGDKIIQNGNNYEAKTIPKFGEEEYGQTEIFNGTLGKIEKVIIEDTEKGKVQRVHIKFEDEDDIVEYSSDEMGQIGLAYALTVHKCQGSGFDHVVFVFDGASFMLLCREFIYTGITRAKKGCIMIAEKNMLHMGIKKSQGNTRRTFLKEFLEKMS